MSSTHRGAARHPNDYYVTPVPAILHFLTEFEKDRAGEGFLPAGHKLSILDPCATGEGMEEPTVFGKQTDPPGTQLEGETASHSR